MDDVKSTGAYGEPVSPVPEPQIEETTFSDLIVGMTFFYQGKLYVKETDDVKDSATELASKEKVGFQPEWMIMPRPDIMLAMPVVIGERGEPKIMLPGGKELVPDHPIHPPGMTPDMFLRPMVGSYWDTEIVPDTKYLEEKKIAINEITFFQRVVSQCHAYDIKAKGALETNLSLCHELPMPCRFQLFGFSARIMTDCEEDRKKILERGLYQFIFAGMRIYFERPLDELPATMDTKKDWEEFIERQEGGKPAVSESVKKATEYFANMENPPLRFVIEKGFALQIMPRETFAIKILWKDGLRLTAPAKIRVGMWGVRWNAI